MNLLLETAAEAYRDQLIAVILTGLGSDGASGAHTVKKLGGTVAGLAFVIELDFLNGRSKLPGYNVHSLLHY